MPLTRLELEQIRNASAYDDNKSMGAGAESGVDHGEDFNYVITQVKNITGQTNWFEAPDKSLVDLNTDIATSSGVLQGQITQNISDISTNAGNIATNAGNISTNAGNISTNASDIGDLQTDISEVNTFIGRADGESNPVYSSTQYVSQSGSLETAIGELDNSLYSVAQSILGDLDWTEVFNNGSGLLDGTSYDIDMSIGSGKKFYLKDSSANILYQVDDNDNLIRRMGRREEYVPASDLSASSVVTIPNGATYTTGDSKFRNLQVFVGGALWNPGAGNDYTETSSSTITINRKIKKDTVVVFKIFG